MPCSSHIGERTLLSVFCSHLLERTSGPVLIPERVNVTNDMKIAARAVTRVTRKRATPPVRRGRSRTRARGSLLDGDLPDAAAVRRRDEVARVGSQAAVVDRCVRASGAQA